MQHIVNLFIGEGLREFQKQFAKTFLHLNPDVPQPCFTTLLFTEDSVGKIKISTTENGDNNDNILLSNTDIRSSLINYFDDLYTRKVTVSCPGNRSMIVIIWTRLFDGNFIPSSIPLHDTIKSIIEIICECNSNIKAEITGFTNDAVSCFIPEVSVRLSPDIYRTCFAENISRLKKFRNRLQAFRLISNFNTDDVALNLKLDEMARICAQFSALLNRHYLDFVRPSADQEKIFESFGLSSIIFDHDYFHKYISTCAVLDKLSQEKVECREFSLNALAEKSNPVLTQSMEEIKTFYNIEAVHAKANLILSGSSSESALVATLEPQLDEIINRLKNKINTLIGNEKITTFESEALLTLILGDDSDLFDVSAIFADEMILDDIIDEAARFFIELDLDRENLVDIDQEELKRLRTKMRNIAAVNRERKNRLLKLNADIRGIPTVRHSLEETNYCFEGTAYKLNLHVDIEPLEKTYKSHPVTKNSVDLRNIFEPIRNQGHQSSCAAFAVASVIETMRPDMKTLSPAFLYWNARRLTSNTNEDNGSSINEVLKGATLYGVCKEDLMPFNSAIYNVEPRKEVFEEAEKVKIIEALTVEPDVNNIRSALSDGYPVIVAARIFDSFADNPTGFIQMPSKDEIIEDNNHIHPHAVHAMVVCGFSDKSNVFLVRNSWGSKFGANGYCFIPYSYASKFFLQSCIIKSVTQGVKLNEDDISNTLKFNENDAHIETDILNILIADDNEKLKSLSMDSNRLKTTWTQNINLLANVNNQNIFIEKEQDRLQNEINLIKDKISTLNNNLVSKLKDFRKIYWKNFFYFLLISLIAWGFVIGFPAKAYLWIIASVFTTCSIGLYINYFFKYRVFRQSLLDEITNHSNKIDILERDKKSVGIQGHIRGKMLREIGNFRLELLKRLHNLHIFNKATTDLYFIKKMEFEKMKPDVPYPFMSILDNECLATFYKDREESISSSLNLKDILKHYNSELDLQKLLSQDPNFIKMLNDSVKGFSMKEYLVRNNPGKWPFLPEIGNLSQILNNLDQNSLPFCKSNPMIDDKYEVYIFAKDINREDMSKINRYFTQEPLPLSIKDPYSISILKVVRYS